MPDWRTVQQAVIGEVLPDIGRRNRSMGAFPKPRYRKSDAGRGRADKAVGLTKNVARVPQSVVKRVSAGGCHSRKELTRQMSYILRDEALTASWSNQIGIERSFEEDGIARVVADWTGSWVGAPKRGHTDHIILSFPKGTDAGLAEEIAREWGQEVFGSGFYADRFRYVAALHHNTEHVHAHFVVDKVGMDHEAFLSISRHSEINYDMMRELHAQIASEHGLALNATPRLSRGLIENAPRETDVQAALQEGREPYVEPLSFVQRIQREASLRSYAADYRSLAGIASMLDDTEGDGFAARLFQGASAAAAHLLKGEPIVSDFADVNDIPADTIDPAGRIAAAREALISEAQMAWTKIRNMEPGPERVELEGQFADQARSTTQLIGQDAFFQSHARGPGREVDPYAVAPVALLQERARGDGRFAAEADAALDAIRDRLADAFERFESRFEWGDTNAEEMAARFAAADRSAAQIHEWRPDDPDRRAEWLEMEREMRAEAEKVVASIPVGRDLLEDLARQELMEAERTDRLSDIAALDRLAKEVRADMSDGDLDRVGRGEMDPLIEKINDPGLRAAVGSELRNMGRVEDGQDLDVRDSEPVGRYRDLASVHERAAHRAERGRGRDEDMDHVIDF
ncbi:relaxase/mobilization nuclease domain-containing protein [Palleronia rufa]|uniref:relaxase/mobilization nuclease domain-containing protein n=1 Tax=Palleronia rufa TaxID=1530186 RepID=UPI0005627529|nr:relaxase/mobilization nuclease domain-containing protein [Palleronia rufa]